MFSNKKLELEESDIHSGEEGDNQSIEDSGSDLSESEPYEVEDSGPNFIKER